jgi:hypothetical protein
MFDEMAMYLVHIQVDLFLWNRLMTYTNPYDMLLNIDVYLKHIYSPANMHFGWPLKNNLSLA